MTEQKPDANLNDDLSAGLEPEPEATPNKRKRGAKAPSTTAVAKAEPERIGIIISESENPKDTHVFISVNGYAFNIKRGERVEVPPEIVHVLENAVESRLILTGEGRHELKSFNRFPFRTVQ